MNDYSEVINTKVFGDMGESNHSFSNDILLENIDKEIPRNFSLLTTPAKGTSSVGKTYSISKLENYINENYDKAVKIQLRQAILPEIKQQLPNETIEKGHDEKRTLHLKVKLAC